MGWDDGDNEKAVIEERKKRAEAYEKGEFNKTVKVKFAPGKHQIRYLSEPKFVMIHWITSVKRSVVCPKTDNKDSECLVCKAGNKARIVYAATIIDRADGTVKVWEFPRQVKEQIAAYRDAFGNPTLYDLVVLRQGKGMNDTRWIITPFNKGQETPLTKDEQDLAVTAPDLDKLYKVTDESKVDYYLKGKLPPKKNNPTATANPTEEAPEGSPSQEDDRPFGDDQPF